MASPHAETFRRFVRSVFETQTVLLKHGDVANAGFGQSSARWRVLLQISAGETSVAAIARATGYSRQAVQRLAGALVADGSARYSPDPDDRRKQRLELTAAGAESLDRIRPILLADIDYMKSGT
jgi:DNA-binding MarR family transcriptional regulator